MWGAEMRELLIDADIIVYQIASVTETAIDWGDDVWTLESNMGDAVKQFDWMILKIKETLSGDKLTLALSDRGNFRKDVYPLYKSHRKSTRKPMAFATLRQHALDKWAAYLRPNLEGDDCLGILATVKSPNERIIVSIDKDFKTIPGKFYNLNRPEEGVVERSEAEADYYHMIQTLTGDTTDGYPGCPKVGPKTAEKILAEGEPYWPRVVAAYEKAGLTEETALIMARCARILRAEDYNFKTKEVKLWIPPCTQAA